MESSQILGCAEECSGTSGSESGWTSYIASPVKNYYSEDDEEDEQNKHGGCREENYGNADGGNESDDSMASDASSGPSHLELPCRSNERSVNYGPYKYATAKYSARSKLLKQVKQRDGAGISVEKEISVLKANSASSRVQGGRNQGKKIS